MGQKFYSNFVGGRVSDELSGRADTRLYGMAARVMDNILLALTGGAMSRPGLENRIQAGEAAEPEVRLEPVILRRDLVFILAIEPARLRVISIAGDVLTEEVELVAPWDATSMWSLSWENYGNLVIFTDNAFWPKVLTIVDGGASFSIADFAFDTRPDGTSLAQPMIKLAPHDMTIDPAATSGTGVNCVTSAAWFTASDVGMEIQIQNGRATIASYVNPTTVTIDIITEIGVRLGIDPFQKKEGYTSNIIVQMIGHNISTGDSVTIQDAGVTTGVNFGDINNTHTVGTVIDEDHFEIPVTTSGITEDFGGGSAFLITHAATLNWKQAAFGTVSNPNPPQAVTRHGGRLWFGGTPALGDDRWGSRGGSFFNFDEGTGQDNHAVVAIGETASYRIRHLASGENLEIYGDTRLAIMPSSDTSPITPTSKHTQLLRGTSGAAFVRPQRHDGSSLYVDGLGLHVREMLPETNDDKKYIAKPVTIAVPEMVSEPRHSTVFEGSARTATPYTIFTNADGTLALFCSDRDEGIAAWFNVSTDGEFQSVAGIGSRLFAAVTRHDGNTYIEEFSFTKGINADHAVNLTSGAATTDWVAPAFFYDLACDVFDDDGVYLAPVDVDGSGNFTIPIEKTSVWIGLPDSWDVQMLPVLDESRAGIRLGKRERIIRILCRVFDTIAVTVNGVRLSKPSVLDVDQPPMPMTGTREIRKLGRQRDPAARFSGSIAERATVLSALVEMSDV